jgi:hypothetical protein
MTATPGTPARSSQFIYLGASIQMWSGGCRSHCRHCTGWHTYCLNGQDTWESTHNPDGVMTHDHWVHDAVFRVGLSLHRELANGFRPTACIERTTNIRQRQLPEFVFDPR